MKQYTHKRMNTQNAYAVCKHAHTHTLSLSLSYTICISVLNFYIFLYACVLWVPHKHTNSFIRTCRVIARVG